MKQENRDGESRRRILWLVKNVRRSARDSDPVARHDLRFIRPVLATFRLPSLGHTPKFGGKFIFFLLRLRAAEFNKAKGIGSSLGKDSSLSSIAR